MPSYIKDASGETIIFNNAYQTLIFPNKTPLYDNSGVNLCDREALTPFSAEDTEVLHGKSVKLASVLDNGLATIPVSIEKRPLFSPDGHVLGIQCQIFLNTQLAVADSLQQKLLLRAVMDAIPDMVFYKDCDRRYAGCNKALELALGMGEAELIGQSDDVLLPSPLRETCYQADMAILGGQEKIVAEEVMSSPEGPIYLESIKTPYRSPGGDIIGIVGVSRDITPHKKREEELREARKAADAANRAKSDFLANMSHEIRTPMNAIVGFTYLMLNTGLTPKQENYITKIQSANNTLLQTINDILDFSKIEADKMTLESAPFLLSDAFDAVQTLFADKCEEKGLRFSVTIAPETPLRLEGDILRLNQVLNNLVSNAIKFTTEGEIAVNATLAKEEMNENGDKVVTLCITVKDTGIGIEPDQRQSLFDPFMQADNSTSRRFGGTGLGLAITNRLIEMQNGSITVESTAGKGTTFALSIPFVAGNASDLAPTAADADIPHLQFTGKKILIVEDNLINQQVAEEILSSRGIEITLCNDGREAVALLQKNKTFDLIFMDLQMPRMDGYEATTVLRQQGICDEVPIVAMTADALSQEKERCTACGMNGHLAKPIVIAELDRILLQFLQP
jgi:PAS domain S-box